MTPINPPKEVVPRIIAEHIRRPVHEILPESRLQADLGIDSLLMIEINVSLETHYKRTFYDFVEEPTFVTVADVVAYVQEKLEEPSR
jgi:acyl carrier protein